MMRTLRSELRKLTTTRLLVGHVVGAAALGGLLLILVVVAATTPDPESVGLPPLATADQQKVVLAAGGNALLLGTLLGTVATTREYGHGTIVPTLLATPRRRRVVAAKAVLVSVLGALVGAVTSGVQLVVGVVGFPVMDVSFALDASDIAQLLGAAVLAGAVGGLLGLGTGTLLRRTGIAVAVVVVSLMIAEPLLGLVGDAARYLPSGSLAILQGSADGSVPIATAAMLAYGLVPLAVAAVVITRRDVGE